MNASSPSLTHSSSLETDSSVVASLRLVLADTYALLGLTHSAHWNVEGPDFFALHQAFEEQYKELFEAVDELAERIRALDAYALGGLRHFADESGLEEPNTILTARDYVAGLLSAHEKTLADLATLRDQAGQASDAETQDLAIGRIQVHQKVAWMLRSFLR